MYCIVGICLGFLIQGHWKVVHSHCTVHEKTFCSEEMLHHWGPAVNGKQGFVCTLQQPVCYFLRTVLSNSFGLAIKYILSRISQLITF